VLREDAGLHAYQMLEAGIRQFNTWGDTDEGRHILVAVTRYLAAHSPTERAALQTADIARRLVASCIGKVGHRDVSISGGESAAPSGWITSSCVDGSHPGDDRFAQTAFIRRWLGERVKSTLCCRKRSSIEGIDCAVAAVRRLIEAICFSTRWRRVSKCPLLIRRNLEFTRLRARRAGGRGPGVGF
jgi:hypothetical protein